LLIKLTQFIKKLVEGVATLLIWLVTSQPLST